MSDDPRHQESLSMPGRCRSCMETWPCQVERLRTDLAAQSLALATLREALRDLCNVVEDARSVGEMQGENFAMSPWSDLERAAPRYLPLLAQPDDDAVALAGAVLEAGDEAIEAALDVIHAAEQIPVAEPSEWRHITRDTARIARAKCDAYHRARAALRGNGAAEGPGREGE